MGMLITKDHLDTEPKYNLTGKAFMDFNKDATTKVAFKMYDDDKILYYSGQVDFDPFIYTPQTEMLIDEMGRWGIGMAGCTAVWFKHGKGKWEQLF